MDEYVPPTRPPPQIAQPAQIHPQPLRSTALQPSPVAAEYLGTRIPPNTARQSATSVRLFCTFIFQGVCKHEAAYPIVHKDIVTAVIDPDTAGFEQKMCEKLFLTVPEGQKHPEPAGLYLVRYFLIEFVVLYRGNGEAAVKPGTMKGYVIGLLMAIRSWGYAINLMTDSIFSDTKHGLLPVLNNWVSKQQAEGVFLQNHNEVSLDDVKKIFGSPLCSLQPPSDT